MKPFGGPWSLLKLEIVTEYLTSFNTALQNQDFELIYIDGFAGSGEFSFDKEASAQLNIMPAEPMVHAGSAKRAIELRPPFDKIYLIEQDSDNVTELRRNVGSDARVQIRQGEANREILDIVDKTNWKRTRGVLFLDPFGNSVEWSTLEAVAQRSKLDVWYLFPLAGVFRNAPRDHGKLTPDKRDSVTRMLGTGDWEAQMYALPPTAPSLFDQPRQPGRVRDYSVDEIEDYVKGRLKLVFPQVFGPRRIIANHKSLYSLFLTLSNDSVKAGALASRLVKKPLSR